MRTLGRRIIDLDPPQGFAAETVAASVLYTTAFVFEAPISTTHTITSAIMGVGATKRFSAVRWGVARTIVTAWVLTFPTAGLVAALVYWACRSSSSCPDPGSHTRWPPPGPGGGQRVCGDRRVSRSGRRCRPRSPGSSGLEKIFLVGFISTSRPGLPGAGQVEEAGVLRDPGGLLHVVGDDDDRVVGLQLVDQVLDRGGRDRVERGAGLVHEQHLRLDGDRAGDAQPLLLTAGEAGAGLVEPVLDLVPEVRAACSDFSTISSASSCGIFLALSRLAGQRRSRRSTSSGTGWAAGRPCRPGGARATGSTSGAVQVLRRRARPCPRRGRRGSPRACG